MTAPEVVFEDRDIIVLNKPAGLLTERDPFGSDNLQDWVALHCGREIKIKSGPGVVHRLDRPTSGLIIMAKKPMMLKKLNADMAARRIVKRYIADILGTPEPDEAGLEHFILKDQHTKSARIAGPEVKQAKAAVLDYKILEKRAGSSRVEIVLHTGRYHQIRVQFSHIGHPVLGDAVYGDASADSKRLHLHAGGLEFTHPKTGERIKLRSAPDF